MNCLEKRHSGRRGSSRGHRKHSNGFGDTSRARKIMDETDREVSNLTDRAFRSLCIGEEAVYNDSEISSPTARHKAFAEDLQKKEVVKASCQETASYGLQSREMERRTEVASTFQQSCADDFRDECLSYMSNGSVEAVWQHQRSTSRVASLIKAFSSGDGYHSAGDADVALSREKSRDCNESWDRSALTCIQKNLPEFPSAYHQNFKSGPFQSYRNHFHASAASVVQMHTAASLVKSPQNSFSALNTTNFFFHSEFSPFQLWNDYNRFPFKREETLGFVSTSEFPRWYDTHLYKELTASHRTSSSPSEGRWFNRRKIDNFTATQRSRSTVIQKASAIEKRCESEITANCPPWRKNNNFMRNKLPSNRPSTVSPSNEKINRADSTLFYPSRQAHDMQHKLGNVGHNEFSSNMTPFSITQLLTPEIHGRQGTETSEILQFARTPTVPDCSAQGDTDMKSLHDAKQLRDSYKAKASSLLFNIKDNKRRVKSTYSPPKCSDITDQNSHPSELHNFGSKLSDTAVSQMTTRQDSAAPGHLEHYNQVQHTYGLSLSQTVEHRGEFADGYHHNMALSSSQSQYGAANYNIPHGESKGNSLHPNKFSNRESRECGFSPHVLLAQNQTPKHSEGHIYDPRRALSSTRPEIETVLSKSHPPAHSAQMSEKQTLSRREDVVHYDHQEKKNFVRKQSYGYNKNELSAEETLFWKSTETTNITNKKPIDGSEIKDPLPFKGEIAALIEKDKQRKANAKQYLPLTNDSYTMGKEAYVNKVNENIKQGRLAKEEEVHATDISQKYSYTGSQMNPVGHHPINPLVASQNLYENPLNKMASPPSKEANLNKGSRIQSAPKDEVCLQIDMNYPRTSETDCSRRTQCPCSLETKQKKEGSAIYQPYKYEPNKQWYIATSENKQTQDEVCTPRQLQQSDQSGETNYTRSISEPSYIQQLSAKRTTQRNVITEERSRTGELKPNYPISPKQTYATKLGDMNSDINKQNFQSTEACNDRSQTREDRFNINDILSIRDNEQAKRLRENKHSLSACEATKLENQPSTFTRTAEDKEANMEISHMKEQTLLGQNSCYILEKTNISSACIKRDSHDPNEGLVNIGTGMKGKSGKDIFMNKENDRITSKVLSYKERGQTKQEILTSKLKAHAQKEISAIKEKGLAKQSIPSRNPLKQSTAGNYEKGQLNQGVLSLKKEITAEKLDHLFQDITYSSVTLYKELANQDSDVPKYEPLKEQDMKLPKRTSVSLEEDANSGKNTEATKDDKLITNEKIFGQVDKRPIVVKTGEFQDISKSYHLQSLTQSTENYHNKCGSGSQDEGCTNASATEDITILKKGLSRSPVLIPLSKEASVVKTDDQTASQPEILNSKSQTECQMFASMLNNSSRCDLLVKTETCKPNPYKSSEHVEPHDFSINKTDELLLNVEVDKHITRSDIAGQTDTNLQVEEEETAREDRGATEEKLHHGSKKNTGKGNPIKEPTEHFIKASASQVTSPSEWTKLKKEQVSVDTAVESTNTETGHSNHKASSIKDKLKLKSAADCVSTNETNSTEIKSPKMIHLVYGEHIPEAKEKKEEKSPEQWAKHDTELQSESTTKPNEDSSTQQLHHTDNPKLNACENTHTNKGSKNQTITNSGNQKYIQTAGVNEHCLLKEPKQNKYEIQQDACQSKQETSSINNPDKPMTPGVVKERNNPELQEKRSMPQTLQGKDNHQQTENNARLEENGTNRTNSNVKLTDAENEKSHDKSYTPNVSTNDHDHETMSCPADKGADVINAVPNKHIIHIPSKEDDEPVDEPVIYSICVSSQSEIVSEEEPIIFTICVSSMSEADNPKAEDTVSHNSSGQEQLSVTEVEREGMFGNIKEETEKDRVESKASEIKEETVLMDSKKSEKETAASKCISPAKKDKCDYNRSSEVGNISSYESLSVKYGLPTGENIHLKSGQKQEHKMHNEKEEPTNTISQKVQKTKVADGHTVDVDYAKHQGSRKKDPGQLSDLLKASEENSEQNVTHVAEEREGTAGEGTSQRSAGVMLTSEKNLTDTNQLISENGRAQNKQDILVKPKTPISSVVPVCEYSQDTKCSIAQKTNIINDGDNDDQLKECMEVRKKVQIMDSMRDTAKENENVYRVDKNADMIMKKLNDNQKTTYAADGNTSTKTSRTSKPCGPSHEDICKHTPDVAPVQNSQKAINEAVKKKCVQDECERDTMRVEILNKDTTLTKDSKSSHDNGKDFLNKDQLAEEHEESKLKTISEAKGKRDIIIQNIIPSNNQMVKGSQSVSKNLIENVSTAMKADQNLFKVSNISLEEKHLPKLEPELNNPIEKVLEKHFVQDKTIKSDSISGRCVLSPKNTNENVQSVLTKVTGIKSPPSIDTTEDDAKRMNNQKCKEEPSPTWGKRMKKDTTSVNTKDNTEKASSLVKVGNETLCESNQSDNRLKEEAVHTAKEVNSEDVDTGKLQRDSGQIKTDVVVKDHSGRGEMGNSGETTQGKHDDRVNVYQYYPGKGFLPEPKGHVYGEPSSAPSHHHDTALKTKDGSLTKPGITLRERKSTRPDISALADYARLRVISAEDDSMSEKDLLQKMDTHQKYNLMAVEPQKRLQGNLTVTVGDGELTAKKSENQSQMTKPSQVEERDNLLFHRSRITKEMPEGHNQQTVQSEITSHPKLSSMTRRSDDRLFAGKERHSTTGKTLTNQMQPHKPLNEQLSAYSRNHVINQSQNLQVTHTVLSQNALSRSRQPANAKMQDMDVNAHVKSPDSLSQTSLGGQHHQENQHTRNPTNVVPSVTSDGGKMEELQYYTVSAMDSEPKPKDLHETFPGRHKMTPNKEVAEIPSTKARSKSSSPAMGKAVIFRVKDNTVRTSPVTKTVMPPCRRSFSDEFRIGSPREMWKFSEKNELEDNHKPGPKEPSCPPVRHEPAVASHRPHGQRETRSQGSLPSAELTAATEPMGYLKRRQLGEDDDNRSVVSTLSDVESLAASTILTTNSIASHTFYNEHNRYTSARPASACYERPESVCFERPESSCSDMRPLGKPPTVPPKTEKALHRAKKLTSRRIKKTEAKATSDSQEQSETKCIRNASSLPSSPLELMSTHHAMHASPPVSHYHVEPNYASPAQSIVAHPFPMTQRKLLQDPNSGQYFMVDMPVQVKTKMFFDPATGKYVQLNVRQDPPTTVAQPPSVEVLNQPYLVYSGFLPMPVSSLPSRRSSSQTSAPGTVTEQNMAGASSGAQRQPSNPRNAQLYNEPVHRTREPTSSQSVYAGNNVGFTQRKTDIITMRELDDFVIENT
ncbi:cardiac-enriched FHL2-interacting protein [Brachyhypopomus gauderio]|uniref:cardiac-enriched FHL2-interacting protein n=1 Tax=Brachyhypopomus gauderio TaxID=698409 RepID=UPI00404353A0